jgi:hypothetical protein
VKPEIQAPTDKEKFEFFADRVCALARDLNIDAYVMLVDVGDLRIISRFPDCGPDCGDPDDCARRIFTATAEEFADTVKAIESGASEVQHRGLDKGEA